MSDHNEQGKGWIEQPKNVDRIVYVLYAVCAIAMALDFVIDRKEYLGFAGWFGFYAWYGFIACVGLVIAAKGLRRLIMKPEDYYYDNSHDNTQANREDDR